MEKNSNVEIQNIIQESQNRKNLTNKKIMEMMNVLVSEHEETKKNIINLTYHFDKIEETYNILLNELESRQL